MPLRTNVKAVAISGSPSAASKSRLLLSHAVGRLTQEGIPAIMIDLAELPANDLLGRTRTTQTTAALSAVDAAQVLLVATPVYRASYSGLLKVFFDLLSPNALTDKVAVVMATAGGPGHQLVLDHALRPLLQSVGALVVTTGVYATDSQFAEGVLSSPGASSPEGLPHLLPQALIDRLDRAVGEALALAGLTSTAVGSANLSSNSRS
jgi:FMN reductase